MLSRLGPVIWSVSYFIVGHRARPGKSPLSG
jgi:hypothetical protein